MKRFVEGEARTQGTLFPERLDDYISEDNPVRVIEAFVDDLDLKVLGFEGIEPHTTGRPAYHPLTLLKLYIYGYLNRIQSSRRLERESQRNVEVMWLMRRLMPDHKTVAEFRKNKSYNYKLCMKGKGGGVLHRYWSSACPRPSTPAEASPYGPLSLVCFPKIHM